MNKIHRFASALCASSVFLTAASLFAQVNGPGAVNDPKKTPPASPAPPPEAGFPIIGYVAIAVVVIVIAIVLLKKKKS